LLADLAVPLGAGDAQSAQIALVTAWRFPPWELRAVAISGC
jgi:hypothetical protein